MWFAVIGIMPSICVKTVFLYNLYPVTAAFIFMNVGICLQAQYSLWHIVAYYLFRHREAGKLSREGMRQ